MRLQIVNLLSMLSLFFSPILSIAAQEYHLDSYPENHEQSSILLEDAAQSSLSRSQFMNQILDANASVEAVEYNVDMSIEIIDGSYESQSIVDALFNIFYDANQNIEFGHLRTTSINEGVEEKQEILMVPGDHKNLYSRTSETTEWDNLTQNMEVDTYSAYPDYFYLLNIINSMEENLELLETNENYILHLTTDDIDLMGLFQEEYDISITGIDQSELEKHALFTFNKDDLLLNFLHLSFYTQGERFAFYIDIQTEFENWNEVDDAFIYDLMEEIQ